MTEQEICMKIRNRLLLEINEIKPKVIEVRLLMDMSDHDDVNHNWRVITEDSIDLCSLES